MNNAKDIMQLINDGNSSILNRHKITKMNSLIDAKMVTPL